MAGKPTKYWTTPADKAAGKKHYGWLVQYVTTEGRGTTARFKTEREASAFKAKVEHETATGTRLRDRARRLTVDDLADAWIAGHQARVRESTHHPIPGTWRLHVKPTWGRRRVNTIKKSEVQSWVSALRKKRSRSTAACALSILSGILQDAVEDKLLSSNPARGIKVGKPAPPKDVWLDHEQIQMLASESRRPELTLVLAYTALRWAEVIDLRVKNVDLKHREIRVRQSAPQVRSQIVSQAFGKTEAAWRNVTYPRVLQHAMESACRGKRRRAGLPQFQGRASPTTRLPGWVARGGRSALSGAGPRLPASDPPQPSARRGIPLARRRHPTRSGPPDGRSRDSRHDHAAVRRRARSGDP